MPAPRSIRAGNVSASRFGAGGGRDSGGGPEPAARGARCLRAGAPPLSASGGCRGDSIDGRRRNALRAAVRDRRRNRAALGPRDVRRKDQRRDLPRRAERGGDRGRGVGAGVLGGRAAPDPGRDVARDRLDVGLERRVVLLVVRRVVADDRHHRCATAPRVVQVGESVAEARTEVQEHRRRRPRACARSRRRRRWPRLRTARARRASPGTASRVATKCISDVPGLREHHVARPTRPGCARAPRRRSSGRPAGDRRAGSNSTPGLRMPSGSNAALIRRHERELGRVLEREEVTALVGADAVLAGDRHRRAPRPR